MADPRFFKKAKNFSIQEIAEISHCEVPASFDSSISLDDVKTLKDANATHLSFLDNVKYKADFMTTKAAACFVSPHMVEFAPQSVICLVTNTPYKAYALAAQAFYPESKGNGNIASTAIIEDTASIGVNASIGHHVYIGHNVKIGANAKVDANVTIHDNVEIGDDCWIGSNATLSHTLIADYVRIYPGVRIGQDGFGFAIDPAGHIKVPQLGRVIIEDHVEIGANTTIDRGASPDTIIGQGTWIDNLVQIGHNVVIGRGCVIVAQVGISGSSRISDYVAIGGQAGIAGHLTIGIGARIGAQSGIMSDIPAGSEYLGTPAFPKRQFLKQIATLNRLIQSKKND